VAAARVARTAGWPAAGAGRTRRPARGRTVPGDLVHLGGSVPQRGADVVDLDLVDGPLLALLGLIRPLPQPPGHDHPHPALQALGHVLRRLTPHVARQEQAVAVLPLPGRVVPEPRRRRHPEPRHRLPRRGKPQLRIIYEIPRDRDLGIACCHLNSPYLALDVSPILLPTTDISGRSADGVASVACCSPPRVPSCC